MPDSPSASPMRGLEAIYRKHHGLVRWVLRARGVPEVSLDDRVHDVFLAIFRRLPERDPGVPMRAWVAGVARNVGFSHRRSVARQRSRSAQLAPPDDPPRPDELLERREAWRALQAFLEDLGPEQREVFVMVEVSGMRVSELAESMGMPANTLHSRLKVARSQFSQRFAGTSEPRSELLARAREQGRADPKQRRRTWGMIVASAEGLHALPPAGALAGALGKAAWVLGSPKLTAVTIVAGLLGAAVVVVAARAPAEPSIVIEHAVAAERDADARPRVVSHPSRPAAALAAEPPAPATSRPPSPHLDAPPSPSPRARARPEPVLAADADAELARAVAALQRAQHELDGGRAREALATLDEPSARFGPLERERRRLELDAACRLGDWPRARRAASALTELGAAADPEAPCVNRVD
jgi:RNA polymerase sigma-70 factor (ECF subfamily)